MTCEGTKYLTFVYKNSKKLKAMSNAQGLAAQGVDHKISIAEAASGTLNLETISKFDPLIFRKYLYLLQISAGVQCHV